MSLGIFRKNMNLGLLILRMGIGGMFMFHGYGKLVGGPDVWARVGGAMANFGIDFIPAFWGLCAGLAEFGGGLCIMLGIFFQPVCMFLLFVMIVASTKHLTQGDGLKVASHAIEAAILFLSLIFIGPGEKRFGK